MNEIRLKLADGRTLAACEVGDPKGRPIFYFHGFPGSRLDVEFGLEAAEKNGLRLIGFDRPGWGASAPRRNRKLLDWPDDVAEAADQLGCDRFSIVGVSGGGPFAIACASKLAQRIDRVGVVCGLGPHHAREEGDGMTSHVRIGLALSSRARWLVRPMVTVATPMLQMITASLVERAARFSSKPDRVVLRDPKVRSLIERSFSEAFAAGGEGAIADGLIYGSDWGIDLSQIDCPVHFWHGEQDRVVPISMGRHVAEQIPDARFEAYPDDGHFSIVTRNFIDIFAVIASRA